MPTTQVQFRRGTTAQNNSFTGADGEVTVDTTVHSLRVHDGLTPGGYEMPTLDPSGSLSISGNVTAAYFLGNGACLSGISSSAIFSGLSNVRVTASGGNIAANVGATSNVLVIASTGLFITGLVSSTGNVTANGDISAVGNISGNYVLGNGALLTGVITSVANINNGNSNVRIDSSGGNILANVGGTANILTISTAGLSTNGILSANNNIIVNSFTGAAEGGQLILAWKGISNLTGQSNSTWNIDVNSSNVFRIFYQDASSNTGVPISLDTAAMTVSNVSITGNISGAGMLNPFLLAGM